MINVLIPIEHTSKTTNNKDIFTTIMNQSDFIILDNSYDLIYNNNTPILLIGLSSYVNNERNIEEAFKYFNEETHNSNIYTISIMSETEDLDEIINSSKYQEILNGFNRHELVSPLCQRCGYRERFK